MWAGVLVPWFPIVTRIPVESSACSPSVRTAFWRGRAESVVGRLESEPFERSEQPLQASIANRTHGVLADSERGGRVSVPS